MGVVVRRSSSMVVRPSEPEPTAATSSADGTIKLSSFDMVFAMEPITGFHVFEHPMREAAETIKGALSRALVPYYPISGRMVVAGPGGDEFHIRCSGDGVAVVAASANRALKDAEFFARSPDTRTPPLVEELAVYYPAERCGLADPLLLMQVTEFSCGGFVVGVTWNHGVADGAGMAQFLKAVGELTRRSPSPSFAPVRWDDSLPSRLSPPTVQTYKPLGLVCLDITVPSSSNDCIRSEFPEHSNGRRRTCTVFEAVAAVLWWCRTRVIASRPDSLALFTVTTGFLKKNECITICVTVSNSIHIVTS
ncbi:acyl transferase 15-like [Panicum virgatum]|uniref:acyl transferase 15-like n=1 Tax=Panicum virgatum TaxID=38727 RepID=UPI0019D684EB|nr:acyl transferase 15-like [Panicum virgatum]